MMCICCEGGDWHAQPLMFDILMPSIILPKHWMTHINDRNWICLWGRTRRQGQEWLDSNQGQYLSVFSSWNQNGCLLSTVDILSPEYLSCVTCKYLSCTRWCLSVSRVFAQWVKANTPYQVFGTSVVSINMMALSRPLPWVLWWWYEYPVRSRKGSVNTFLYFTAFT